MVKIENQPLRSSMKRSNITNLITTILEENVTCKYFDVPLHDVASQILGSLEDAGMQPPKRKDRILLTEKHDWEEE